MSVGMHGNHFNGPPVRAIYSLVKVKIPDEFFLILLLAVGLGTTPRSRTADRWLTFSVSTADLES